MSVIHVRPRYQRLRHLPRLFLGYLRLVRSHHGQTWPMALWGASQRCWFVARWMPRA